MAPPTSVLSRTLQSITLTKIRELEKQRTKYENRKHTILEEAKLKSGQRETIAHLLAGVKELYPGASTDANLQNIERWLDQSRYDASIPVEMLRSFDDQLRTKLDVQSRKLGLADLYSHLLTEWMTPQESVQDSSVAAAESTQSEDSFEVLEKQKERLQELCDKFESVVFEPLDTDEVEIDNYMQGLFVGDEGIKALESLRSRVKAHGDSMLANKAPFDEHSLTWCIKGLLAEDLLSDEKQTILQDFLENKLVLGEIADVLNMRFADLKNWTWEAGAEGIPVMPRQGLNGKYRIWMDEDVLQAIFVHYVGIEWCVALKATLMRLVQYDSVWKWEQGSKVPQDEHDKRSFYLGSQLAKGIDSERRDKYTNTFLLSQLPSSINSLYAGGAYDDDSPNPFAPGDRNSTIKQQLLRRLATEVLLHESLRGEVAVVQSDLKWYATGLSHSTIFAVMRFVGFSEDWIAFFKKFLEAPLNMNPSSGDTSSPRLRKRGVPMAHAPEKLIGELVLFAMDMVVNKEAGMLLYRLHDDLWLVGEPERCAEAWTAMNQFAKITGLEFNRYKTGSVYLAKTKKDNAIISTLPNGPVCIGFLTLDPETGTWIIDQTQVDAHVTQLQKQLASCSSVLSWIQTWNSCIGRFFSHTFGEPAYCFGRQHVDSILETHERIQRTIFGFHPDGQPKNVTEHLKAMIHSRFGVSDIPDAFLYLPEQLGGLNLRNPFVSLFLVREQMSKDPKDIMKKFFADEKMQYAEQKKAFEELDSKSKQRRLHDLFPRDTPHPLWSKPENISTFMDFPSYTAYRESTSFLLRQTYIELVSTPTYEELNMSREVQEKLGELEVVLPELRKLEAEKTWMVILYSRELLEKCGGLSMVEKSFLPLGVLTMMRLKKVTWQMVL